MGVQHTVMSVTAERATGYGVSLFSGPPPPLLGVRRSQAAAARAGLEGGRGTLTTKNSQKIQPRMRDPAIPYNITSLPRDHLKKSKVILVISDQPNSHKNKTPHKRGETKDLWISMFVLQRGVG